MKKNYQKPMCVSVPLRAQGMICESKQYTIDADKTTNTAFSRGFDADDDE